MAGYSNIRECTEDMKLLVIAKRVGPDVPGNNARTYLLKKIRGKLKNASQRFLSAYKGYTFNDYYLIGVHEGMRSISCLEEFLGEIPDRERTDRKLERILKSKALKEGKLPLLEDSLPKKLESKEDLVEFIKSNEHTSTGIIRIVCNHYHKKKVWKSWIDEAIKENRIHRAPGGWF